jgi:hypothetical protein
LAHLNSAFCAKETGKRQSAVLAAFHPVDWSVWRLARFKSRLRNRRRRLLGWGGATHGVIGRSGRNPRTQNASGIPFHADGRTIIKEKLYLDKLNPDTLYDEITVIDNALTRPWSALKTYRRGAAKDRSGGARMSARRTTCTSRSARRTIS